MTETDFFRIARERMWDYTITIRRESTVGAKPYKAALQFDGKVIYGEDETLAALLSSLAARAGVDRRATARAEAASPPSPDDPNWPGG
jgi:hypothetical protein